MYNRGDGWNLPGLQDFRTNEVFYNSELVVTGEDSRQLNGLYVGKARALIEE